MLHSLFGAEKSSDLAKLRVYLNTVALKTYNPGAIISNVRQIKFHELYDRKTKVSNIFKSSAYITRGSLICARFN